MQAFVNGAVRTPCTFACRECRVEIGFLDIGLEAVDAMQGRIGIDGDGIWTIADDISIFLVEPIEIQMPGAFPGMVDRVPICDASKKRTWVFGQSVDCQAVDDQSTCLL